MVPSWRTSATDNECLADAQRLAPETVEYRKLVLAVGINLQRVSITRFSGDRTPVRTALPLPRLTGAESR